MSLFFSRLLHLMHDKTLRHQIARFVVAGFTGLFTDLSVYRGLVALGAHVTPAKALGCVAGTIVVFFINRSWTFSSQRASLSQFVRFSMLYGASITVNTTLNTLGLHLLPEPWQVSFVFATGVSTVMNFLGSKFLVFKPAAAVAEQHEQPGVDLA
ncbi:MAG: GtrA family protein [Betaproteobacteria bacterium]|nr:GtrA family protein [Betaproteobacteria bacterium]